jgi:hypothetical protein
MIPQYFVEANTVMRRPPNMTEEQCIDIHAMANGQQVVTCWKPTETERVKIALGEPVWLVLWGSGMQPALVTADKPFEDRACSDGPKLDGSAQSKAQLP